MLFFIGLRCSTVETVKMVDKNSAMTGQGSTVHLCTWSAKHYDTIKIQYF